MTEITVPSTCIHQPIMYNALKQIVFWTLWIITNFQTSSTMLCLNFQSVLTPGSLDDNLPGQTETNFIVCSKLYLVVCIRNEILQHIHCVLCRWDVLWITWITHLCPHSIYPFDLFSMSHYYYIVPFIWYKYAIRKLL